MGICPAMCLILAKISVEGRPHSTADFSQLYLPISLTLDEAQSILFSIPLNDPHCLLIGDGVELFNHLFGLAYGCGQVFERGL